MDIIKNQYKDFAYFYDELMKDIDYKVWTNYIIEILKKYNIKHRDILEMACGTGNISINLAKMGYSLTAFDISEDMLSVASSKMYSENVNISLLLQDMCNINIEKSFGIILCLCDSLNYVISEYELENIFKWVHNHLLEGGIFIFDINSSYKLRNIIGNNTFTYNEEDISYIWDNYLNDDNTVEFYLSFFIKQNNDIYKRIDEEHIQKIYEIEDIIRMLKKQNFKNIDIYEAFSFEKATYSSERINFVVRK